MDSRGYVALEVKSSVSWRGAFQRGLSRLIEELGPQRVRAYGVFGGARPQGDGTIPILPLGEFLRMLWDGGIIR